MANDPVDASLAQAGQALTNFVSGPVMGATASIERAVDRSFGTVARTIASASLSGRNSVSDMTRSVLADFDRIAVSQFIVKPVQNLVSSFAQALLPVAGRWRQGKPIWWAKRGQNCSRPLRAAPLHRAQCLWHRRPM
jgi:hypothetical protein